jgi:hypothetical protein
MSEEYFVEFTLMDDRKLHLRMREIQGFAEPPWDSASGIVVIALSEHFMCKEKYADFKETIMVPIKANGET